MGTEILRPQDCLFERIRVSPCRRSKNFYGHANDIPISAPNPNTNFNNYANPRFGNRKPAVRSDQRRRSPPPPPSISKRSASVDDLRITRNHQRNANSYGCAGGNGNGNSSLVMEKVTILRRGESLDSKIKSTDRRSQRGGVGAGAGDDLVGRLGPDPEMVRNQIRIVDLKSPVAGRMPDVYAGSAFAVSPAPSALPLPSFSKKKQLPIDDSATRDLRRMLRLDF